MEKAEEQNNLIQDRTPEEIKNFFLNDLTKFFFLTWGKYYNYNKDLDKVLFRETNPQNVQFFDEMIKFLNDSKITFNDLLTLGRISDKSRSVLVNVMYKINKFVVAGHLNYQDGVWTKVTHTLDITKPVSSWQKIIKNTQCKMYDLIIKKDGTIYVVENEHDNLAYWLMANSIDITGGLRVNQHHNQPKTFSISSLSEYTTYNNSSKDYFLKLSTQQAENFVKLFSKLCGEKDNFHGQTLEELVLNCSENLGSDITKTIFSDLELHRETRRKNYLLFEEYAKKEGNVHFDFNQMSRKAYEKYMNYLEDNKIKNYYV